MLSMSGQAAIHNLTTQYRAGYPVLKNEQEFRLILSYFWMKLAYFMFQTEKKLFWRKTIRRYMSRGDVSVPAIHNLITQYKAGTAKVGEICLMVNLFTVKFF